MKRNENKIVCIHFRHLAKHTRNGCCCYSKCLFIYFVEEIKLFDVVFILIAHIRQLKEVHRNTEPRTFHHSHNIGR